MTSIVTSILQCTSGVLFNIGRDLMAEKLKDGDVTDQKFRELILRELDDLKSKIDGLARKDLLASLSFFREGMVFINQLFDQKEPGEVAIKTTRAQVEMKDEKLAVSTSYGSKLPLNTNSLSLVDKNKMLNLNELSEIPKQLLLDAKKNFELARCKVVEAFSNEALKTSDRLLAMKIRILATIMEKIDCPAIAMESCKLCLEELHKMPVVQNYFSVEIRKPVKFWFKKRERWEVIANVCQMKLNYAVYRVTSKVRGDLCDQLPFITIDHLQIDPLRDARMIKVMKEVKVEHCMLQWTFGNEGESSHKLDHPYSITTNTQGQFIVADDENVKVFDPLGKFLYSVLGSENRSDCIIPILTYIDRNDNLYLCTAIGERPEIRVFDRNYDLRHTPRFPLTAGVSLVESFTISNDDQVFVVVCYDNDVHQVDVYENDGRFVHSFGENVLSQTILSSHSITTNGDGVMILDSDTECVHVFSAQGAHLYKFQLNKCDMYCCGIVFFKPRQHVLILYKSNNENRGQLSIYTKDGKLVRSVLLDTSDTSEEPVWLSGITVTVEGQVAITNFDEHKVHVLQL